MHSSDSQIFVKWIEKSYVTDAFSFLTQVKDNNPPWIQYIKASLWATQWMFAASLTTGPVAGLYFLASLWVARDMWLALANELWAEGVGLLSS